VKSPGADAPTHLALRQGCNGQGWLCARWKRTLGLYIREPATWTAIAAVCLAHNEGLTPITGGRADLLFATFNQNAKQIGWWTSMIAYKTSKNARILFVGINPHPGSYRRGVPFSNNKMFWYLLNRSGLLEEAESDLKDDKLLQKIYDRKFLPKYGLNFLNLVDRPTIDVAQLKKGEEHAGVKRVKSHPILQAESSLLHR
jgi:hypothetical protein